MPPLFLSLPFTKQGEGECLAACADMVLAYIGRSTRYKRIVRLLKTQTFGTPFRNIRHLERLGVTVQIEKGTIETLHVHLQNGRPCIVFVDTDELPYWDEATQHALVVVGMDDQHIWTHDPDQETAPTAIPLGDFDLAWFKMGEWLTVITQ